MDIMLRQKEVYERMYNCNFYSVDMIPLEQRKHPAYGVFLITLFVVFEVGFWGRKCKKFMLHTSGIYRKTSIWRVPLINGFPFNDEHKGVPKWKFSKFWSQKIKRSIRLLESLRYKEFWSKKPILITNFSSSSTPPASLLCFKTD